MKSSSSELPFTLFRPRIKPPIKAAFISIDFIWNGEKWNIKVVGTMNISRRYVPDFCLNPETKSTKQTLRHKMAKINKIGVMLLFEITSTVF